jgi:hypothetical protein
MKNVLRTVVLAGVLVALALLSASVGMGGTSAGSVGKQAGPTAGDTVHVNFVINRFVRQGRRIVAQGEVIARYRSTTRTPDTAVVRKRFTARLGARQPSFSSATRICNVLELTLAELHLELLGLIVHLDRVHLTIRADSRGGLLGSLFCSIAGRQATPARLDRTANRMTRAGRANGLNQGLAGFRVQVAPTFAQTPGQICQILDLVLGPLDLNLLGLLVHLDRVHLSITARQGGGILGDLFCALAGGPSPPPPPPPPAPMPSMQALAAR